MGGTDVGVGVGNCAMAVSSAISPEPGPNGQQARSGMLTSNASRTVRYFLPFVILKSSFINVLWPKPGLTTKMFLLPIQAWPHEGGTWRTKVWQTFPKKQKKPPVHAAYSRGRLTFLFWLFASLSLDFKGQAFNWR